MKIMFICTCNICRSPMAEYIFKHMMQNETDIEISSAGISGERVGEPIYPMAGECLTRHGIPFDERRAVVFRLDDYFDCDYVICMDEMQKHMLKKLCLDDMNGSIYKLLEFSDRTTEGMTEDDAMLYTDVFDPHLDKNFERAYETICEGLSGLKKHIEAGKKLHMMKEIGRGSTTITKNRFLNDHELTEITIAEDVRTISDSAFEGCEKLQTVHFSEGLRRLSKGAFRGCVALRGVKLPQSVVSIQANVFSGCVGLETVILPEDLRRNIERGTFADCKKLQHIDIPAGLSKICTGAFGNCKALQTVCFKSDDILIEDDAFRGCESLSDDARDYIEKHTIEHDVIDIISDGRNEAGRLSNFTARSFVFDGIECGSIEGVLQSFKCSDTDVQREICKLAGGAAKNAGETHSNWMIGQTLYWQGVEYPRNSSDYQLLLDRLYDAVYEQDEGFRRDLAAISRKKFDHSIGNSDMRRTVLTRKEFVGELRRLIKENIGRSEDRKI